MNEQQQQATPPFDVVGQMMAFEDGELSFDEIVELFQHLTDTGIINSLQGFYQRTLAVLVADGWVTV